MPEAMIVAAQAEAAEAGASILRAGGNAVDAAIACALVQGVVDPLMAGIAGFGSAGIYFPGKGFHKYPDFHAPSPGAARPEMWEHLVESEARDGYGFILKDKVNDVGYQSACVPASLKAYFEAHSKFGVLPWRDIVAPAIAWADSGWMVRPHVEFFWSDPGTMGRASGAERLAFTPSGQRLYCRDDGTPKRVGDLVQNPDYANTLRMIAEGGSDVFYRGELARRIDRDMRKHGGLITADDLASSAQMAGPLRGAYRGYEIATNNPPGGGLMLLRNAQRPRTLRPRRYRAQHGRVCSRRVRGDEAGDRRQGQFHVATPVSSMSRCRAWLPRTMPPQWPGTSPRARRPMCRGSTPDSRPRTPPRFA